MAGKQNRVLSVLMGKVHFQLSELRGLIEESENVSHSVVSEFYTPWTVVSFHGILRTEDTGRRVAIPSLIEKVTPKDRGRIFP